MSQVWIQGLLVFEAAIWGAISMFVLLNWYAERDVTYFLAGRDDEPAGGDQYCGGEVPEEEEAHENSNGETLATDLMVSVERVWSTRQEKSLNELLTPAGLRAIGIILKEFMMDRVQTLRNASTAPSSVIDDLRACIEKSEAETTETKETNQDKIVVETDEGSILAIYKVRACFSSHAWKFWLVLDPMQELQHTLL